MSPAAEPINAVTTTTTATAIAPEISARFGLRILGSAACPECGGQCERFQVFGITQHDCPSCNAARTARRRLDERRADCLRLWLDVTPAAMQPALRRELLAPWLHPALELDGTAGAGFAGVSGGGKTRVAFHLLRLAAFSGKKPYAVAASHYRQAAAARHDNSYSVRARSRHILDSARHAGALLLDDIGKGASTPAGDEALFDLLDFRRNHHRLTFWTANGGSQWLAQRLGPDFGPAIARRLADLAGSSRQTPGRLFMARPDVALHSAH